MDKRLTIKELADELNISVQATNKKVDKLGLSTTKELLNNRLTTVVILSENQLNDLKMTTNKQPVYSQVEQEVDNGSQQVVQQGSQLVDNQLAESMKEMAITMRESQNQVVNMIDKLVDAQSQVRLLEDFENRSKSTLDELRAEVKQLKEQNNRLKDDKKMLGDALEASEDRVNALEEEIQNLRKPWYKKL